MQAITPKTEVSAVNLILRNAGETPVNSLEVEVPLEAAQAQATLAEVSEDVQSRGWYFNTETHLLSPNEDGRIVLPANTLAVQTADDSRGTPVTARGKLLYNLTPYRSGFVFDAPVRLRLTLGLAFGDLPATARRYIALRAARVFEVRENGDPMTNQNASMDEARALAELHAEQLSAEPVSLRQSSDVMAVITQYPTGLLR